MRKLSKEEIPKQLFEIPGAPKQLYIEGKMPPAGSVYFCVVGSRNATSYSREMCAKLIEGLKGYPIVVVSGLALGIDTVAHESALKAGLRTVAFPGSGLDPKVLYPSSNKGLARRIVEAGGCLLSEFEPDFTATDWSFPQRNRLMAGLARATLIVEAREKSGTLITARLALDYNRDVLVIPGPILAENTKGSNKLLKDGAAPVLSSEDILETLGFSIDTTEKINRELADCSDEEKNVLEILIESFPRDELIREMNMPTSEANTLLSIMEIKGLIKEELGEIRRA